MKLILSTLTLALMLTGCGKDSPTLGKQEDQRSTMGNQLRNTWKSSCLNKTEVVLKVDEAKINVERTTFFDVDCKEKKQVVKQSGTYKLASNFKEGVNNSIVFTPDAQITTSYAHETDMIIFNNAITRAINEKEVEIAVGSTPDVAKNLTRRNLQLRALKELTPMSAVNQEKTLNRLQQEKMTEYSVMIPTVSEMSAMTSIRYELDNGFLQMCGPKDFSYVFSKQ